MKHFNGLSPAEAERLAMLMEEAAEVVQVVGKILRHGYDSWHPDDRTMTNRMLLEKELADFMAVREAMLKARDLIAPNATLVTAAWQKKLRYAHHQENGDE